MNTNMQQRILRKKEVLKITGWSNSTLYSRIKSKQFPPPISLGERAVGFILTEVNAMLNAFITEKASDEVTALVSRLILARKKL